MKYREINELHKQMLRVSAKVAALPAGAERERALHELLQGQSNDCYWHGVFGGIYIAHMRLATFEHLIAAEDLADSAVRAAEGEPDGIRVLDTDLDGVDELYVGSPGQVVVIAPAHGAGIGSWDIRAVCHALTAVMRRRPEAYHRTLLDHEAAVDQMAAAEIADTQPDAAADEGEARSPRSTVWSASARVAWRLDSSTTRTNGAPVLSTSSRRAPPGRPTPRRRQRSSAMHTTARTTWSSDGADSLLVRRDVIVRGDAGESTVVRVDKRFTFDGDRRAPGIRLEVTVGHRSGPPIEALLGVEWALMMLGGGGNPAAYYEVDGESSAHDAPGEHDSIARIASGNRYVGLELVTSAEPPATTWWSPIETVSNSEYGFERIYQGSALVQLWPVRLAAGERCTVTVDQRIATTKDRAN